MVFQWESIPLKYIVELVILLVIYLATRLILYRVVSNWALKDSKNQQSWFFLAKRLPTLVVFLGVLFIWGHELRDLALSLVAVAAALVLATKELILCFMGGLMRASSKLFEIDDRISVAGFRGKVVEQNFLTTILLEIGPGVRSNQSTGKFLKIPNSLFLGNAVTVVPSGHDYILHTISITMPFTPMWRRWSRPLRRLLLKFFLDFKKNLNHFKLRIPRW